MVLCHRLTSFQIIMAPMHAGPEESGRWADTMDWTGWGESLRVLVWNCRSVLAVTHGIHGTWVNSGASSCVYARR